MRNASLPKFFATPGAFRAWLQRHAAVADELVVGYYKVGSGRPSMTWSESVDEALCFGWIDGVRASIDERSYQIRFTPRRRGSTWSAVNIAKVKKLIAQGRMEPAGLEAYAHRKAETSNRDSRDRRSAPGLSLVELRRFRSNRAAWEYFEGSPPGYRRTVTEWVASAKRAETRERRLERLIEACGRRSRLY